jgi:hypothetical protein
MTNRIAFPVLAAAWLALPSAALAQLPPPPDAPAPSAALPEVPPPIVVTNGGVAATPPQVIEELPPLPPVPPDAPVVKKPHKVFIGVTGGVGFANVHHPDIATPHVIGPVLAGRVGYQATDHWALSLVFTDFEQNVSRSQGGEEFSAASQWVKAQAACSKCVAPAIGGAILNTMMRFNTLGPGVDFTPFGRDWLFIGASGGLAMAAALHPVMVGAGGEARAGFRLRLAEILSVSLAGGIQGEIFSGANAMVGFGEAEVRLHL